MERFPKFSDICVSHFNGVISYGIIEANIIIITSSIIAIIERVCVYNKINNGVSGQGQLEVCQLTIGEWLSS